MRYTFTLPASFDATEFLPSPYLAMRADDARWLMSTIVRKTANRDTDPWGCIRLNMEILRRIMYKHTISDVITALENGGAIETAPACVGVKSRGYRLAKRYLSDRHVRRSATDVRLIERIERERQRQRADEQRHRWTPIHFALDAEQTHVTITNGADRILETLPGHTRLCQDVLVGNIRRREYPFSVSSTGRVFNSITGIKRELRKVLRIDGQTLGSVDIRNAQPALLAMMIRQQNHANGVKKLDAYKHAGSAAPAGPLSPTPCLPPASDAALFADLACTGGLYERLMDLTGMDRDSVKLRVLVDVLAKRGRYPSRVEQAFRSAFPSVYRIIKRINRDDHGELIRRLQRMESTLVVETVAPRLVGRIPVVTLHDAIYSRRPDVGTVADAFNDVFDEIGFTMALKCE